jgi:hypothetical protein
MKQIIIYSLTVLTFVGTWSCTDLDPVWYDKVTPETFYKTKDDIYSALGRPFTHFNWFLGYNRWLSQEVTADHFVVLTKGANFGGGWERLQHHDWDPEVGEITESWGGVTMGVSLALDIMQDIKALDYERLGLTEDDRAAHVAQLNSLIAYFYLRGLDFFGGMPLYEKIEGEGARARNTDQETFDHIEKLLKQAITDLPAKENGAALDGTIKKGAAAAMLAQLYFNAGAYTGKPMYNECAAVCQEIIDGKYGPYELDPAWYGPHSFNNDRSPEVIWVSASERNKQEYNWFYAYHYHYISREYFDVDLGAMNASGMQPSRKPTGELYAFKLGKPYEKFHDKDLRKKPYRYLSGGNYEGMFIIGEHLRPDGTPITGSDEYKDKPLVFVDMVGRFSEIGRNYESAADLRSTVKDGEENSGVRLVKTPIPNTADISLRWAADLPIIRLAEMYYTLAECKWRSGDRAGAAELINKVRARNFEGRIDPDPATAENLDEWRMIDEWGVEFLGEGRRRTDLIRWDKYVTAEWWDHQPGNDKNLNRFPLPNTAIFGNTLLKQNPGYE